MARRRILLSAYFCMPGRGSEFAVGWDCATALAERHRVWVLTRAKYRDAIEAELRKRQDGNLSFVYLDLPRWLRLWESNRDFSQIYYYVWQLMAPFRARRLCRKEGISLIHHVTMVKYWAPSLMGLLSVPFVWGPVGGGESMPRSFAAQLSTRGRIYETLRDIGRWIGTLDPLVRLTARSCTLALATTDETAAAIRRICPREVVVSPAIGLVGRDMRRLDEIETGNAGKVRYISIGRMLHWKGTHLGLQAFAKANLDSGEYWLIGDGAERERLEELAARLGVSHVVRFWGELSREETLRQLSRCHVLVHPSLHDSGGIVCLEAMAARRPVICLGLGGPSMLVSDDCGIKVSADGGPEHAVADLAAAMRRLAENADLRYDMGEAGHRRVAEVFQWDRKAEYYEGLYERALSAAGTEQ